MTDNWKLSSAEVKTPPASWEVETSSVEPPHDPTACTSRWSLLEVSTLHPSRLRSNVSS